MKFIRYAPMSRLIIRHYSILWCAISRPSLLLLMICIKMRPAKESYMKFYYLNRVRYGSVRVYSVNNRASFSKIKNIRDLAWNILLPHGIFAK